MRCWAEINLENLRKNVIELEKITAKKNIMTVVKANAYGHGMIEIFDELVNVGITWFGIATFEEAMALRERNKEVNILIFGPIEKSSMKIASENDLRFPIVSFDEIDYLNSNNINCNIHVKIDTGMGRVGFQYQDAEKAIELIKNSSTINIEGIFSHLSSSESNEEYTRSQIEKFDLIVKNHKEIKYKHILNSFGSVLYQDSIYDFIRPGIILYGGVTEDGFYFDDLKVNVVYGSTGIENLTENGAFLGESYPNPTKNNATINYVLPKNTTSANIVLTNTLGQVISKIPLTAEKNKITISTQLLEQGIYYYYIESENKRTLSKKMMILN